MKIKSIFCLGLLCLTVTSVSAQDGNFETITFNKLVKRGSPTYIFGWGENFDHSMDSRPNPHPTEGTMMINHHTGLTLSAHSAYGGIRFYNQGYPNTFDAASGAKMVMSITGGNVGIGTASPEAPLTVFGQSNFYPARISSGDARQFQIALQLSNFQFISNDYPVVLKTGSGDQPLVLDAARIGIGTATPLEKLSVNGKIRAQEIKVETANWPDYVFTEDYQITKLEELERYIKEHQHLPELPSAKEAEANGVALGEMNKLLLKKIEELTLHLIEKDKALKLQSELNLKFEKKLMELEKKLDSLSK